MFGSILKRIGAAFQAFKRSTADVIPDGFIPISDFSPDDVFIVGYPKSGNTWFQHLVAGVVYGVDPKWAPIAAVQDLVPDASLLKYYRRYAPRMFFKEHSLPRPDYRRVVYLLRDGRDAMVSYRHYREAVDKVKYDFQEFVAPKPTYTPVIGPGMSTHGQKTPMGRKYW